MKILIIDDSRSIRAIIKVFLMSLAPEFLEAEDGRTGLTLIQEHLPALVLCDMRMPHLDGVGLCEALRTDPRIASIPVLMLTGEKDDDTRDRALKAGAREVLHKPIAPGILQDAVRRFLPTP
jgi:CheY-like chemotaxis protein